MILRSRHDVDPMDGPDGPAGAVGPDALAVRAVASLNAGVRAHEVGDLVTASSELTRSSQTAALLASRAPDRDDAIRMEADALLRLAGIQLALGDPDRARTGLDTAERLYSRSGPAFAGAVAEVRARRSRAHAALGHGLSALIDAQSAMLAHVEDPDDGWGLASALAAAAYAQARHGGSRQALYAAHHAGALFTRLPQTENRGQEERILALHVEIRMLRALRRANELEAPAAALQRLAGTDALHALLREPPEPVRPDLLDAVRNPAVPADIREAVEAIAVRPCDGPSVPGLLVEPAQLLNAAREGAATALALAEHDADLAFAAGRDAACLYACAEELGLLEHPWPRIRVELARWVWLLTELGWLAVGLDRPTLAADLADHAQHPLTRAECGRHLPSSIARSLGDSAASLRDLRLHLG